MIAFLLACSGGEEPGDTQAAWDTQAEPEGWAPIGIDPDAQPPALLSELGLTRWDGSALSYHDEVLAYELNTPLFSDFALKDRAIWMPEGLSATVSSDGGLDFPVGTVILKSFLFPADFRSPGDDLALIETRVLLREARSGARGPTSGGRTALTPTCTSLAMSRPSTSSIHTAHRAPRSTSFPSATSAWTATISTTPRESGS